MTLLILLLILLLNVFFINKTQAPSWGPMAMIVLGVLTVVALGMFLRSPSKSESASIDGRKLYEKRIEVMSEYLGKWLTEQGSFKKPLLLSNHQVPEYALYEAAFTRGAKDLAPIIYSGESGAPEASESETAFHFDMEDVQTALEQHPEVDVVVWMSPPMLGRPRERRQGPRPGRPALKFCVMNADKEWLDTVQRNPRNRVIAAILDKPYGSRGSDINGFLPGNLDKAFESDFELVLP